jgi:hypothetical protein
LELNRHIERFFREIENEMRKQKTDVEAFLEKYETRKITFIPIISEVRLDQRTKNISKLSNTFSQHFHAF